MAGFDSIYHELLQKPTILLKDLFKLTAHPEQVRAYCQKLGLLGDFGGPCPEPNCTGNVSYVKDGFSSSTGKQRLAWKCGRRACRYRVETRDHSFFENSHLSLGDIILLIYGFVHKYSNENIRREIGIGSDHTVVDWFQFCRDICCEILLLDNRKIGGE
jgi:hypothetical protein